MHLIRSSQISKLCNDWSCLSYKTEKYVLLTLREDSDGDVPTIVMASHIVGPNLSINHFNEPTHTFFRNLQKKKKELFSQPMSLAFINRQELMQIFLLLNYILNNMIILLSLVETGDHTKENKTI